MKNPNAGASTAQKRNRNITVVGITYPAQLKVSLDGNHKLQFMCQNKRCHVFIKSFFKDFTKPYFTTNTLYFSLHFQLQQGIG